MQYITILDYVILPFVLAIVYALAYQKRNKKYPHGHPWRPYFIPGLTVKIFGAIFIGMLYQYYYRGGDTFNYYLYGKVINSSVNESFIKWINLLFHIPDYYDAGYYQYTSQIPWYHAPANYTVCAITAFISFFTLGTYLPAAVIFAYVSFSGMWALFRTFASLYPGLIRPIAFAVLFIRLGNFVNQEILGTLTNQPWGVIFGHPADGSVPAPRHPVQLYEALAYLVTFILLLALCKFRKTPWPQGFFLGLFLICIFGSRFFLEYFKAPQDSVLDESFLQAGQILSLPFIFLGAGLIFYSQTRSSHDISCKQF